MIPSCPNNDINEFTRFIYALSEGTGFNLNGISAAEADINMIRSIATKPLPPLYLEYLRRFGTNDGALQLADDANPSIPALRRYYEKWSNPPNLFAISTQGLSGQRALVYSDAFAEPRVAVVFDNEIDYYCASSFQFFLYRRGYVRVRFPNGALFSVLQLNGALGLSNEVKEWLLQDGFRFYWFSDDYETIGESNTVWIVLINRSDSLTLHIDAPNLASRMSIVERITRRFEFMICR
jgi:hypothetical protein